VSEIEMRRAIARKRVSDLVYGGEVVWVISMDCVAFEMDV
jgi:hypothetical protein